VTGAAKGNKTGTKAFELREGTISGEVSSAAETGDRKWASSREKSFEELIFFSCSAEFV
jgi:hypothetical protein